MLEDGEGGRQGSMEGGREGGRDGSTLCFSTPQLCGAQEQLGSPAAHGPSPLVPGAELRGLPGARFHRPQPCLPGAAGPLSPRSRHGTHGRKGSPRRGPATPTHKSIKKRRCVRVHAEIPVWVCGGKPARLVPPGCGWIHA